MRKAIHGFRDFITRGNLIELAVAFVIGAAFATLVQALVADLITPIIAAIFGEPSFSELSFTINESEFLYGDFLNALFTFATVAAAIYFIVVVPYERIEAARAAPAEDPTTRECTFCIQEVPLAASRCPHCTSELPGVPAD